MSNNFNEFIACLGSPGDGRADVFQTMLTPYIILYFFRSSLWFVKAFNSEGLELYLNPALISGKIETCRIQAYIVH